MTMKNLFILLLFIGGLLISSCSKEEKPFQDLQPMGSILTISDVVTGFYDLADPQNASVGFTVASVGENVSSAVLQKSINGGAPVDHATVSSFPSSFTVSLSEALEGLGVGIDQLEVGDQIVFSFKDVTTQSGTFASGATVSADVSCASKLEGTYDLVATGWCGATHEGTITFKQIAAGEYDVLVSNIDGSAMWSDMSMGAYFACYETSAEGNLPGGTVRIVDICNALSYKGASQWEEVYEFNSIKVDGPVLTIDWKNDYDPEAGVAVITRTDGTNWPALKKS